MKRFLIYITSMPKGYLGSVARILRHKGHIVDVIVKSPDIIPILRDYCEIPEDHIHLRLYPPVGTGKKIVQECLAAESRYGERFAMLCAHDRGLGKGYIHNADVHPDARRSYFAKEVKYEKILSELNYFEDIFSTIQPDVVLGYGHSKALALVCRARRVAYLMLLPPRVGNYYTWAEDEFDTNKKLTTLLQQKVKESQKVEVEVGPETIPLQFADYFISKVKLSYLVSIPGMLRYFINDTKRIICQWGKNEGLSYLAWLPVYWNRIAVHRFLSKVGVSPDTIAPEKYVVFPLQVEPESSLLYIAPEQNNSMEMISWLSKSLPADYYLVVKEHPYTFGVRSIDYYKKFLKMGNVFLAHPRHTAAQWIDGSAGVATITGSMGFEAVNMLRPVISFGSHQLINHLPTVFFADNFWTTRETLSRLLALPPDDKSFSVSKRALNEAIREHCFELPGFEKVLLSTELAPELAEVSVANLFALYPHLA